MHPLPQDDAPDKTIIVRGSLEEALHWIELATTRKIIKSSEIEKIRPLLDLFPKN
jgi:hypothetical protein